MEIRRDFYLDKLIKRKHNGLIKIILKLLKQERFLLVMVI